MPTVHIKNAPQLMIREASKMQTFFRDEYKVDISINNVGCVDRQYTLEIDLGGRLVSTKYPNATKLLLQGVTPRCEKVTVAICQGFNVLETEITRDAVIAIRPWFGPHVRGSGRTNLERDFQTAIRPVWEDGLRRGIPDAELRGMISKAIQELPTRLEVVSARLAELV